MSFNKKTWVDREVQYPGRRTLTHADESTEVVTLTRNEGAVAEAGDALNASTLNNLENRIESAIEDVVSSTAPAPQVLHGAWTAASSSAVDTQLTESITLTPGIWIVIGQNPPVSTSSLLFGFANIPNFFWNSTNINSAMHVVTVPEGTTLTTYILAAAADSRTFSNITNGFIQAVKI